MNPFTVIAIVILAVVLIARKRIIPTLKEVWKELTGIILILLLISSCASQPKTLWKKARLTMTVTEVKGDSAVMTTPHSGVRYNIASKGRYLNETKMFYMYVRPAFPPGEFYAKIYREFEVTDTAGIRRANKIERYMNPND